MRNLWLYTNNLGELKGRGRQAVDVVDSERERKRVYRSSQLLLFKGEKAKEQSNRGRFTGRGEREREMGWRK